MLERVLHMGCNSGESSADICYTLVSTNPGLDKLRFDQFKVYAKGKIHNCEKMGVVCPESCPAKIIFGLESHDQLIMIAQLDGLIR